MKITGTATLHADRTAVWNALNDPATLVATIPGCQRLEEVDTDSYQMTVAAGVGSIKGVYRGQVRLGDKRHPEQFVLHAAGAGGPGTVGADVLVTLTESADGTTTVSYDADAVVGGLVAGVGQRMISGVAKKTAAEFFGAVDLALTSGLPVEAAAISTAGTSDARPPTVFTAPGRSVTAVDPTFRNGAVVGALAALFGALVGGWLAGRRHS